MKHRKLTLAVLLLSAVAAALACWPRVEPRASAAPDPQRRAQRRRPVNTRRPRVDYTKFTHSTPAHRKDSCASCHRTPTDNWQKARAADAAFPDVTDYPEHASCLSCHRQQFFVGARPAICTVCHTVVSPRAGDRHPFANPPEAFARAEKAKTRPREFALVFPHDLHQDVRASAPARGESADSPRFVRAAFAQDAGAKKARPNSCSTCHQTYGRPGAPTAAATPPTAGEQAAAAAPGSLPEGLLKTTPTSHASCFNCHWQDGGEKPFSNDCAGCHKLSPRPVPPAQPSGKDADAQAAARAGFTDLFAVRKLLRREAVRFPHDASSHRELDCASCHMRIHTISTLDDPTLKVSILSCGGGGSGCHISAKPKKILNDEVDKRLADASFKCVKCHVNYADGKTPRSHLDAVGK